MIPCGLSLSAAARSEIERGVQVLMFLRKLVLPTAFLLVVLPALHASAELLLYERTVSVNRSVNTFDGDQFDLDLIFGDHQFVPTNEVILFDGLVVSPADVGSIYEAALGGDANFLTVSGRVTDSLNEYISVSITEDILGGLNEQRISRENKFFQQEAPPDLSGSLVEKITMEIDSFTLAGPGDVVEGDPVDLVVTISFFGIPEPQTIALLGFGLAGLLSCPKLRHRRD